jgi:hypothetical protein
MNTQEMITNFGSMNFFQFMLSHDGSSCQFFALFLLSQRHIGRGFSTEHILHNSRKESGGG